MTHCITDAPFWAEVLKPRFGHCLENPLTVLLPVMEGYAAEASAKRRELAAAAAPQQSSNNNNSSNNRGALDDDSSELPSAMSSVGNHSASAAPFGRDDGSDGPTNRNTNRRATNEPFSERPSVTASGVPTAASAGGGGGSLPPAPPIPHMSFEAARHSPLSLSLLQHVLMYMCPMDQMRYAVPAMSSSWSSTACVERGTNRVVTHGSIAPPAISGKTQYKSVVCGDTFIALLTANNEVQVAGHLETPPAQMGSASDPQLLRTMTSNRVKMLSGQGSKLLALTTAHTVRPLSVVPANTKTLIPYRLCKFLQTGLGDDCYMVGFDNILYKTTASQRALGTPRRVMTMNKVGVSRVASGAGFLIAIDLAGRLYTMGKNKRGQLGNGKRQDSMRKPYLHAHLQHHYFINAAAGDLHSIVLASDGTAYAAGCNSHGQLGLGRDTPAALTFTRVPLPARCTSITAGPSASMFACADGRVYVCGFNEMGMLGVDSVSRTEKVIFKPLPLSGIENGVIEMVLDNFSLASSVRNAAAAAAAASQSTSAVSSLVGDRSGAGGLFGGPAPVVGPVVSGAGGGAVPGMPHASGFGENGSTDVFVGSKRSSESVSGRERKSDGGCCCVAM